MSKVAARVDLTNLRARAAAIVSMSSQAESMLTECDVTTVRKYEARRKRLGLVRTDMHTMYDVPFQAMDIVSTLELRKIAENRERDYTSELQAEAKSILRVREDPQDRDTITTQV